jgi:hypothetical protein
VKPGVDGRLLDGTAKAAQGSPRSLLRDRAVQVPADARTHRWTRQRLGGITSIILSGKGCSLDDYHLEHVSWENMMFERARAIYRCGVLLGEIEPSKGGRPSSETREGALPSSRTEAATDAGLSEHQRKTALRVANVPEAEFEKVFLSQTGSDRRAHQGAAAGGIEPEDRQGDWRCSAGPLPILRIIIGQTGVVSMYRYLTLGGIRDAVDANSPCRLYCPLDPSSFPARLKLAPSASARARSRSARSLLTPSVGGLTRERSSCFLATSRE